jgi:hypothetical protein
MGLCQTRIDEICVVSFNIVHTYYLSPETEFQIDKIVRTRNKGGIEQHLVKWKGYDEPFNSWINASDINRI